MDDGLQIVQRPLDYHANAPEAVPRVQEEKQAVAELNTENEFDSTAKPKQSRTSSTRRSTLWVIISLLIVIITAVAIGVGVSQSKKSKSSPSTNSSSAGASPETVTVLATAIASATTSSSPTNSSATSTASIPFPTCGCGILPLDCPSIDQTEYISTFSSGHDTYKYLCNVDFGEFVSKKLNDISVTNASSINECMDHCTRWNHPQNPVACLGATFDTNLTVIFDGDNQGNCFLKRNVSSPNPIPSGPFSGASGLLLA